MGQSGPPPGSHQRADASPPWTHEANGAEARPRARPRGAGDRRRFLAASRARPCALATGRARTRRRRWPGQVERGLPGVGGDAGEGLAAGERIASEPGALVAEHQRHRPAHCAASAGNASGSMGAGRSRASRRPHHPAAVGHRLLERVAASRAEASTSSAPTASVRAVRRPGSTAGEPAPLALPKFFIARAAAPRFSGGAGWTRMKRTAVGMRGRTLPPSGNERRRRGSGATGAGGSCSVPAAARGAAPRKGSAETAGGRTLGT
jgi:hypothetical protein